MRYRTYLAVLLFGFTFLVASTVWAQTKSVSVLGTERSAGAEAMRDGLRDALKAVGFVEGRNLKMLVETVVDDEQRLSQQALNLVLGRPDVLVALSIPAAQALMRKRVAAGALLRGVAPRNSREYALGLGSTSVSGNSSANINVQPQVIFRPERLVVPSNLAVDFLITDIKVGKNSQLVSTGALPAVMFTEVAFGVRLKMDTCQISMFVTVAITNQNPAARNFQGAIIGPAVE